MPNYTFTASSCYSLSTHEVSFTSKTMMIKLTSTGQVVYSKAYSNGIDIMCQGDDFCVGTLTDNGVFSAQIDFANTDAAIWLVESTGENILIGSNNETDVGIYNNYVLNECPVRLKSTVRGIVDIECPCASSSGPCGNSCYSYGS